MYYALIIAFILLAFAVYWIGFKKPNKIKPFPEKWRNMLEENVAFYAELNSTEKQNFEEKMLTFLNETYIQGVKTNVTDLDKILVAASAVIPIYNFQEFHYTNLKSVLLYPASFNHDMKFDDQSKDKNIGGLVGTGRFENQMILSKKSLHAGFAPTTLGTNTGIHEFVHLIDKMDGETDGVPEILMKHAYTIPWLKLMHKEIKNIIKNKSELRTYGATNEAEFFAVAAEYFFEKPAKFQKEHQDLYESMFQIFNMKEV